MTEERVIAQVKPHLKHCLEQRNPSSICAFTTWLVHRHGYGLYQHLLRQPEWSGHRLWWEAQVRTWPTSSQPPDPSQPQVNNQVVAPAGRLQTRAPEKTAGPDKTSDQAKITSAHDHGPAATPAPEHSPEDIKTTCPLTPAQLAQQRLKVGRPNRVPIQPGAAEEVSQGGRERQGHNRAHHQKHHSLNLRGWLPRSHLPHQHPQQDVA